MNKREFRPHHIFCMRFLRMGFPERGEEFGLALQKLRDILQKEDDVLLEMNEGIDDLCRVCNNCQGNCCKSPKGDEAAVRKWDNIILKGLRSSYGDARTSKQWRNLIEQEGPLDFCQKRCPKKLDCSVFSMTRADSAKT